jgi:hypothetical protein
VLACQDVGFEVARGEALGIIGESGSGKTTKAVANHPALLLLDEPTTGLDASIAAGVLDLIRDLIEESGVTALVVSHDMQFVMHAIGRVGPGPARSRPERRARGARGVGGAERRGEVDPAQMRLAQLPAVGRGDLAAPPPRQRHRPGQRVRPGHHRRAPGRPGLRQPVPAARRPAHGAGGGGPRGYPA